jgi:hypothetical protein
MTNEKTWFIINDCQVIKNEHLRVYGLRYLNEADKSINCFATRKQAEEAIRKIVRILRGKK